jgi:hypothetical protein
MNTWRSSLLVIVLALTLSNGLATEGRDPPRSAKDREELLFRLSKFEFKGYGALQWMETNRFPGRRILIIWYCPFSGRGAVYVHGYFYDEAKWNLFLDRFLDRVEDLSVEFPAREDAVRLRDPDGNVVLMESLAKLPRANQER